MRAASGLFVLFLIGALAACAPAQRHDGTPVHLSQALPIEGVASWYGPGFIGRRTANGEIYTARELTAAHRTLPFGTLVRVTNLHNGQSVVVRINDRGPFVGERVIDLSQAAAERLDMIRSGLAWVRLEFASAYGAGATLLAQQAVQLTEFDVILRHYLEGELVLLTSEQAPYAVLVRVVGTEPGDADLLLSAEAYEILGGAVSVQAPMP
jgi:rare lipoprotein A